MVEIEITHISKPRDFPLIRSRGGETIHYENKLARLVVDQITLEDLVEFQGVDCKIVQCIYWVGDNTEGGGSDGVTPAVC